MGAIRDAANTTYSDGPSGNPDEPLKSRIRTLFGTVEDQDASILERVVAAEEDIDDLEVRVTAAESLVSTQFNFIPQIVAVRTTANVNLSNALENGDTLNGVTLATGMLVAVLHQSSGATITDPVDGHTNAPTNGLYIVPASGAASRATIADTAAELAKIAFTINGGTVGAGEQWGLNLAAGDITVGTTGLNFTKLRIEVDTSDLRDDLGTNPNGTGVAPDVFTQLTMLFGGSLLYRGAVTAATDLSTLTLPGIYWLASGGAYTKAPETNKGYSDSENHFLIIWPLANSRWRLTMVFAFNVSTSLADIFRKGWVRTVDSTSPGTVTGNLAWTRNNQVVSDLLSQYYNFKGTLSSPDLNTIVATGVYIVTGTPTNGYSGVNASLLEVENRGGDWITQRIIPLNHPSAEIVRRIRPTSDYGDWRPVKQGRSMHKTFALLGDSISQNGSVFLPGYTDQSIATLLGHRLAPTTTPVLMAMGGARLSDNTGDWVFTSGVEIGEAIGANDFTALTAGAAALNTSSSGTYDYRTQVASIAAWNWSTTQRIIAFYGRNDKTANGNTGTALGFDSDSTGATFKGAINKFVTDILTTYPLMLVTLVTPLFSYNNGVATESDNSLGYSQFDYAMAVIDCAHRLKVQAIDLYHGLGANELNFEDYFQDLSHPRYPYNVAPSDPSINSIVADIIASQCNFPVTPPLLWRSKTVNLTADNQLVGIGYADRVTITSDNATPANRTFVLGPPMNDRHVVKLVWGDADAGELIDNSAVTGGGNVRLSADWTPGQNDTLTLQGHGQDWVEIGRVNN